MANNRNRDDERLFEVLRTASRSPAPSLLILDARPKLNARANKTAGKGFENVGAGSPYPNCVLSFCDIGNIHVMRKSLAAVREACYTASAVDNSGMSADKVGVMAMYSWLEHVSRVLTAAISIVVVRPTYSLSARQVYFVNSSVIVRGSHTFRPAHSLFLLCDRPLTSEARASWCTAVTAGIALRNCAPLQSCCSTLTIEPWRDSRSSSSASG